MYSEEKFKRLCSRSNEIFTPQLMRLVLKYVGNVSNCLSTSKKMVPPDYVTKVSVDYQYTKTELSILLEKRPSITTVDFHGNFINNDLLETFIAYNPRITTVIVTDCIVLFDPPQFDMFRGASYALTRNVWTMTFKHRKVDIVLEGGSALLEYWQNHAPIDIIDKVLCNYNFINQFDSEYHLAELVPFFNCPMDKITSYNDVFADGISAHITSLNSKIDSEGKNAAVLYGNNTVFRVAVLTNIDDIWKISYVLTDFDMTAWNNFTV